MSTPLDGCASCWVAPQPPMAPSAAPHQLVPNALGPSITLTCQTPRCAPLPTRGDGSFDALYVGPRVRVSQNVEGGGVRTVHVRVRNFGGFR